MIDYQTQDTKNYGKIVEVFDVLKLHGCTLATAESCTGGMLATLFTSQPGSSAVFLGGVSAYANSAKIGVLGVDSKLLADSGAVSGEVAAEMARKVLDLFGADFAISITGIAGPSGGSTSKPVGTVWLGFSSEQKTVTEHYCFSGSRNEIRNQAATKAVEKFQEFVLKKLTVQ